MLDEVQVGLDGTGRMSLRTGGRGADILVLAKGLSGGLVPSARILSRRDVWMRAYGGLRRGPTRARLDVQRRRAGGRGGAGDAGPGARSLRARAEELGERLGRALRASSGGDPMVRDIRGRGLLRGIELFAPGGELSAMAIGQWVAVGLMQRGIVSQVGTQAPDVIRAEPPLIAREEDIDAFARALGETLREHAPSVVAAIGGAAKSFVTAKLNARAAAPEPAKEDRDGDEGNETFVTARTDGQSAAAARC